MFTSTIHLDPTRFPPETVSSFADLLSLLTGSSIIVSHLVSITTNDPQTFAILQATFGQPGTITVRPVSAHPDIDGTPSQASNAPAVPVAVGDLPLSVLGYIANGEPLPDQFPPGDLPVQSDDELSAPSVNPERCSLPPNPLPEPLPDGQRICAHCGKSFTPKTAKSKCCSEQCVKNLYSAIYYKRKKEQKHTAENQVEKSVAATPAYRRGAVIGGRKLG